MDGFSVIVQHAISQFPGSRRELARKAGVPHATLSAIARGTRRATPTIAQKIAKGLQTMGAEYQQMASASNLAARLIEGQGRS